MRDERARRVTLKERLRLLFLARPGQWIPMSELAAVGGVGGWRTRLSELSRDGFAIAWNGKNGAASAHRYQPTVQPAPTRDELQGELFS